MKQHSLPHRLSALFCAAEGVLYVIFLALDLLDHGGRTVGLKYAGILLCVLFALLRGTDRLIPAALLFTAAADFFLLVRGDHLAIGVGLFWVVQALYTLRLRRMGAPMRPWLRTLAALTAVLLLLAARMVTPLNLLALIYFSQLAVNTALAWRLPGGRLFAAGLTLFVGCDICVGLFNVLPPSAALYPLVSFGMWMFYLPSQVLIALSGKKAFHEDQ